MKKIKLNLLGDDMWQNISILNISKHVFFIHKYKSANDEDMGNFIFVKKEKYS